MIEISEQCYVSNDDTTVVCDGKAMLKRNHALKVIDIYSERDAQTMLRHHQIREISKFDTCHESVIAS